LFDFIAGNRRLFPETQQQQFAYDYAAEKFMRIRGTIEKKAQEKIATEGSVSLGEVGEMPAHVSRKTRCRNFAFVGLAGKRKGSQESRDGLTPADLLCEVLALNATAAVITLAMALRSAVPALM
jgi:hypothetical protein